MNVSEHYEYKKNNDKQIADFKAEEEKKHTEEKKQKKEQQKEQLKNAVSKTTSVITNIPHFSKAAGVTALLGLIGTGASQLKNLFDNKGK